MKKSLTITGLLFLAVTALAATTYTPQVDPGTTNIILVDARGLTGLSATISGTGLTWYSTTLTLTNNPTTNGTQVISVLYSGANSIYTWTNQAGAGNLVPGATTGASTSNLLATIAPAFTSFTVTQPATNAVTAASYGIPFVITNSAGWATLAAVTNAPAGNITATAAVSDDTMNWQSYPGLNLTLPLSSGQAVAGTNTPLYGWQFVQYTIASVATNGACPTFKLVAGGQ
jgi:hypothetical protein